MTIWQPGMRCVFVREYDIVALGSDANLPVKGRVYTVREALLSDLTGEVCLRLQEISNAHMIGRVVPYAGVGYVQINGEPTFEADRFRPLSDARIEQFRALLAPRSAEPA